MKNKYKLIVFLIMNYFLIFQNFLQSHIHIFQFFDEIISLLFFPSFFIYLLKKKKTKDKGKKINYFLIFLLFLLFIIGIFSNVKYHYQPSNVVFSDILIFYKFFFVFLFSYLFFDYDFFTEYSSKIRFHISIIIFLLFMFSLFNYIFKIWPCDYRFGIMSNKIFYTHPTMLAAVCVYLMSLCFITKINYNKSNKFIFFVLSLLIISTLRFKAIGTLFIILLIIFYVNKFKRRLSISKLLIFGLIALSVGWKQISYYYFTLTLSARSQLTVKSIEIARDYFPVGTGFGTYGSFVSSENYSQVYYLYNLSGIQGLQKGKADFVSDTFWPMILGQFGFLGFIIYLACLIIIFVYVNNSIKADKNLYIAKMICFVYLIISSTSESAFVHPMAIPLALIIGISFSDLKKYEEVSNG